MMDISKAAQLDRRCFIGGSDARTIMGDDEDALLRLWREKRAKPGPKICLAT
jgi:hypothetical protein